MKCSCNDRPFYPAKVKAEVNGFERTISFKPGYKCEVSGGKSHGQHGMDMIFMLKGSKGVIQFVAYTGWPADWQEFNYPPTQKIDILPADLGYHSYEPQYEGQTSMGKCSWLNDKECYYDGSGLQAYEAFKVFVSKGEEALWDLMEERYVDIFCQTEADEVKNDAE